MIKKFENFDVNNQFDMRKLENLSDSDIRSFFEVEDTIQLKDDGILGEVKNFILSGKKEQTMSSRINIIEKKLINIIVQRWLKMV